MLTLEKMTYKPLSFNESVEVTLTENKILAFDENKISLEALIEINNDHLKFEILNNQRTSDDLLVLVSLEYVLTHQRKIKYISILNDNLDQNCILVKYFKKSEGFKLKRSEFFQLRAPWHALGDYKSELLSFIKTNDLSHPLRDNPQSGVIYKRYIPEIKKTISFRVIEIERDLKIFNEWHNQFRVSKFWELKGSLEEHREYITKKLADNHLIPVIAELDEVPLGYFELYWTYEDRLGPYYTSTLFDRGFHFLIGNRTFLGVQNTDAVLKSLVHMLFLDDEKTTKIMAEPRADNTLVLNYVETFPVWKKLYEFDFPHKRAALIEGTKERFITGEYL